MKLIRKFFRERRGMNYGSANFGCVGGAFSAFVGSGAGLCSFAAVDRAYLTREPWQNVPFTEFQGDGVIGTYKIYADTDNHCLYFAVSMQDQQVEPGANTAAVALNLQVFSAKFSTRKFTFTTGADKALQSYDALPAAAICRWKYWKTAAVTASQTQCLLCHCAG